MSVHRTMPWLRRAAMTALLAALLTACGSSPPQWLGPDVSSDPNAVTVHFLVQNVTDYALAIQVQMDGTKVIGGTADSHGKLPLHLGTLGRRHGGPGHARPRPERRPHGPYPPRPTPRAPGANPPRRNGRIHHGPAGSVGLLSERGVYELDEDTRVEADGEGRFRGRITDRWSIGAVPNGGYVLAVGLAAVRRAVEAPDPIVATAHYLRPTLPDGVRIDVEVVKAGKRYVTAEARLVQRGEERVRIVTTFGTLPPPEAGPQHVDGAPPPMPPPEACITARPAAMAPAIAERFDMRIDPASAPYLEGKRGTRAELRAEARLADGRPADLLSLAVFADAFPPAAFNVMPMGWVPTLEPPCTSARAPRRARCVPASRPASCSAGTWTRTASCGTRKAASSPSRVRLPSCPAEPARASPPRGQLDQPIDQEARLLEGLGRELAEERAHLFEDGIEARLVARLQDLGDLVRCLAEHPRDLGGARIEHLDRTVRARATGRSGAPSRRSRAGRPAR